MARSLASGGLLLGRAPRAETLYRQWVRTMPFQGRVRAIAFQAVTDEWCPSGGGLLGGWKPPLLGLWTFETGMLKASGLIAPGFSLGFWNVQPIAC